jgi:D-arabinose 1-dehydrogenase-like Zn-dependent alcohol dehydrogenase
LGDKRNLVDLPEEIDFVTAASLGCRFVTSFRAVVDQGRVSDGQWVAVHGCGGVGLSAIMIAAAMGANVVAMDIFDDKVRLAREVGAMATGAAQCYGCWQRKTSPDWARQTVAEAQINIAVTTDGSTDG